MSFKTAIIFLLLFAFVIPFGAAQQMPNSSAQATASQANMANTAEKAQLKQLGDDSRSTQDDLKKMRAIVAQMEANLAFVDNTQSPLKHQFQLEIDMWKALISHMEKRAGAR